MRVNFHNIVKENKSLSDILHKNLTENINHGQFILGPEVKKLERIFSKLIGVKYSVTVSNGTSALYLVLKYLKLKKNDEVITVSNSYISSTSVIALNNLKIKFVDVDEDLNINTNELKKKITKKTKAIIAVHLTGNPTNMDEIIKIAKKRKIFVIEDAAQAIGAKYKHKMVGGLGDFGCFSFHPLKNIGALGDGGIITTNNKKFYAWAMMARNNGHPNRDDCNFWSLNLRMDNLQASFIISKLKKIKQINRKRLKLAKLYIKNLKNVVKKVPNISINSLGVFNLFIIRCKKRDKLKKYLQKNKIETKIHYPKPVHKMNVWKLNNYLPKTDQYAKEILSLPINHHLNIKKINYVCKKIIEFYKFN